MAVLAAAGILPPVITDGFVDEIITAILGVLTVYYRSVATTQLTATTTEEETTNEWFK